MSNALTIHFAGLSLWMDRGSHIDVLFPRAELMGLEPHHVAWSTDPGAGLDGTRLVNEVLDLTQLPSSSPGQRSGHVPGVAGVSVFHESRAAAPDAVFNFDFCTAGLRLPPGYLSQGTAMLIGPFRYRGAANVYIGHGISWSYAFPGPDDVTALARTSPVDAGAAYTLGTVGERSRRLTLYMVCLSRNDGGAPPIAPGEQIEDFKAYWPLLSPTGSITPLPSEIPTYVGGYLTDGITVMNTILRPCPPVMGERV